MFSVKLNPKSPLQLMSATTSPATAAVIVTVWKRSWTRRISDVLACALKYQSAPAERRPYPLNPMWLSDWRSFFHAV